jgi:hypothetical protein
LFTLSPAQGYHPTTASELGPARLVKGVETPLDLALFA